jgi:hypothetical protein
LEKQQQIQEIQRRYNLLEESLLYLGESLPIYQTDIQRFGKYQKCVGKKSRRQVPTYGSLSVAQGIRHVELRNEAELLKKIRRERKIQPKTPPKLSKKTQKIVEDAECPRRY